MLLELFNNKLQSVTLEVNAVLEELLKSCNKHVLRSAYKGRPFSDRLLAAMHYGVSGGKRIRPFLTAATVQAIGHCDTSLTLHTGAAIECLHCYSLIHDDLPSVDNAKFRRGRKALHHAFDEATAILVGDALHALAFSTISDGVVYRDYQMRCELSSGLSKASVCMADGQMLDLAAEGRFTFDRKPTVVGYDDICNMQSMKTGALIQFAVEAGAIICKADDYTRRQLGEYGEIVGLLFQIVDDLLDLEASSEVLGKDVAKDAAQHKGTLVSLCGTKRTRMLITDLVSQAEAAISSLPIDGEILCSAAHFIACRVR